MVRTGGRCPAGGDRRYGRHPRFRSSDRSLDHRGARRRPVPEVPSVKVDPAVQRRLLDLAEVDAELNRIEHRRRTLPEIAEITEGEQTLRVKKDALVAVETTLGDLNRDAKRQEDEIDAVRAREDRDRKLLKESNVGARQLTD